MSRGVLFRVLFVLVTAWLASFYWEYTELASFRSVSGEVTRVEAVMGGRSGDNRRFTITYRWDGERYNLVTARGIIDSLGRFRGLSRKDRVPLLVDPDLPREALLDSFNSRYPITLSITTLALILLITWGWLMFTGRLRFR
ncbi:MAG: DUF3592 domain-containing protein [Gammaproteobacteria bacterium]|nr:DUF3592 domain-containing protein [Gammaproteobacteria bacterium]